jgi:exosortase/archaeosortase family protein
MNSKTVFRNIFIAASIILTILPALATLSSVLTRLFLSLHWYVLLQDIVVPFEAKLVAVLIKLVGITGYITPGESFAMALKQPSGQLMAIELQWNCLGWQSMIFLIVSLVVGLRGKYTLISKVETALFGIIGTFLINLFRMAVIIALAFYWNRGAAILMHDYFATLVALLWIILFWWFSYRFLLEPKKNKVK